MIKIVVKNVIEIILTKKLVINIKILFKLKIKVLMEITQIFNLIINIKILV